MSGSWSWLYELWPRGDSVPSLLVGVTAILLIGSGIARLWPRTSAAQRHLIWSTACLAVLFAPVLQRFMPKYELRILPAPAQARPAAGDAANTELRLRADAQHARGAVADTVRESRRAASIGKVTGRGIPWTGIVFTVWAAGAFVVLMALLRSGYRINQFAAGASPLVDRRVHRIFAELATAAGCRGRVELKEHRSAIPMVCGLVRHVIVLPREVTTWPNERIRHVLLHELAHIVRHDPMTQAAASLAVAGYWFHPLVWVAARELRREREQACDDAVLAAGSCPAVYATDLLDLTATFTQFRAASLAALTFARPSHMHERLNAVLDTTRRRALVSQRATFATWSAAISAVALVVGLTLHPKVVAMAAPRPVVQLPLAVPLKAAPASRQPGLGHAGHLLLARLKYTAVPNPDACGGSDSSAPVWRQDYPMSVQALMQIFATVTKAPVDSFAAVAVTDTSLLQYPIAMITEPGCWNPTNTEVQALRSYLTQGGLLMVDDLTFGDCSPEHCELAIERFERWMQRVLPTSRVVPVPASDSLFNGVFKINPADIPRVSPEPTQIVGIYRDNNPAKGLIVIATYRGNLGAQWRDAKGTDPNISPGKAAQLGVNILSYGLSH